MMKKNREQWLQKCSDVHTDAVIYNNDFREIKQVQELKLSISVGKRKRLFVPLAMSLLKITLQQWLIKKRDVFGVE